MVYANRSRGDLLKGGFGGLKRAVARDQARKAAQTTLETMKSALEARRYDDATLDTTTRRHDDTTIRRYDDTTIRRYDDTTIRRWTR